MPKVNADSMPWPPMREVRGLHSSAQGARERQRTPISIVKCKIRIELPLNGKQPKCVNGTDPNRAKFWVK